jgi:hypothetical protein
VVAAAPLFGPKKLTFTSIIKIKTGAHTLLTTKMQQKSIYRFAPGTEHKRTAIALKDDRFLEVKPTKQMFANGDAWSASFVGEGALLADGIAAGKITFKIRYGYNNSVGNRIQNERGACSVYVMSKDGSLHNVGFTPRKGGSLVISGYTENGNSQKRIVAQRFCDISSDFAEDAPLFICVKPGPYGNLGWLDSAGSFYRVDVDGQITETPQKILYINTGNESVHREFHRKSYSPETAAILQRIRDAGYLVGCICNSVNNYIIQTKRYTTVTVGDIRDYQYDRWSLADFVKRAEKKLFGK